MGLAKNQKTRSELIAKEGELEQARDDAKARKSELLRSRNAGSLVKQDEIDHQSAIITSATDELAELKQMLGDLDRDDESILNRERELRGAECDKAAMELEREKLAIYLSIANAVGVIAVGLVRLGKNLPDWRAEDSAYRLIESVKSQLDGRILLEISQSTSIKAITTASGDPWLPTHRDKLNDLQKAVSAATQRANVSREVLLAELMERAGMVFKE